MYNLKFVDTFDCIDLKKRLTYCIGICNKFHIPSTLFVVVVVTVSVVVFISTVFTLVVVVVIVVAFISTVITSVVVVVVVVIISSMFMKRKQNF